MELVAGRGGGGGGGGVDCLVVKTPSVSATSTMKRSCSSFNSPPKKQRIGKTVGHE